MRKNIKNKLSQIAMVKLFSRVLTLLLLTLPLAAAGFYDISDPSMGTYEGFWTAKNGAKGRLVAQIRPISNNQYDGFVLLMRSKVPVAAFTLQPSSPDGGGLKFTGATLSKDAQGDLLGKTEANCELLHEKLSGKFSGDLGEGTFEASKTELKSPTVGAKPSRHAIVLLDAKPSDQWKDFNWKVTPEGMQVGSGDLRTTERLANFRLHLEFRTPYMPSATGQMRGNSGVYLQSKYEVQVLDSFGLYPLQDNDCGGIYKVQAPRVNACYPPMTWQTYDITFVAANPTQGTLPTITVDQNGVRIIDHVKVPKALVDSGTPGGDADGGFLKLQDHGNAVQYRNIWAEPIFSVEKKR